ncbi:MAG: citryl-CoA lyase [Gammaproteobacteria bacterium]|nr:citryl-CoA lyase [Gammaproteobacteria bacterium]MDH5302879.1 citryl-CoA lyase [Gammaproteobacteria bacterium]MDH5320984.1 citryl-CoA lyase [Gammaproteobacteria bacterium]
MSEYVRNPWWHTGIINMEPGVIEFFGYPIQDLIGKLSFSQMIFLMLRAEIPTSSQAALLDAALMSGVDHGPQAPSIAIARMAITCGVGLNNAMASALNTLGDVHGGAGEQSVELFQNIASSVDTGTGLEQAVASEVAKFVAERGKYIPGFGHRFHDVDPRAPRLLEIVRQAARDGAISGRYREIALAVEASLADVARGKRVPMNIDGATAVVYAELGFPAPLARGLFCLSRAVGILAHAWEQQCQGGRNKGPIPRNELASYTGPAKRTVPEDI